MNKEFTTILSVNKTCSGSPQVISKGAIKK